MTTDLREHTIAFTDPMWEELKQIAATRGMNVSALIRDLAEVELRRLGRWREDMESSVNQNYLTAVRPPRE